jgi:hypothetical protein
MARYNTSLATGQINGTATIGSPYQGAFTEFTGTGGYTVTLPTPSAFPGANQTFYNATSPSGIVTLSTPSGNFVGTGGPGTNTYNVSIGNVVSVTSDGTNYIVISEDGSPLTATTGSFSSNFSITSGNTSITPSNFSLTPSQPGTMDNVSIGVTTKGSGAFTTLTANQAVTFTSNTASSSTTSGTLVVTGGVGVSGTVTAGTVNATNLGGTITTASQTNITALGTIASLSAGSVSASLTVNAAGGIIANGENFEKYLGVIGFDNTVANQATNIQFGNFAHGGLFEVTISSTYSYQNSAGGIKKIFSVLCNPSNAIYGYEARVTEAIGPIVNNFAIGDFQWNGTQYIIPISHILSTGNPVYVHLKVYGMGNTSQVYNNVTLSAAYTLSALSRNYEHFNNPVGIGTSSPNTRLQVDTGSTTDDALTLSFTTGADNYYTGIKFKGGPYPYARIRGGTSSYGPDKGFIAFDTNYNSAGAAGTNGAYLTEKVRITPEGMLAIGTTVSATNLGSRVTPKLWSQGAPAVFATQSSGSTYPDYSATALMLGPNSTRSATMGLYYGGISFDGLLNYTSQGNMTYNNDPHAWIGIKYYDTPGYERASFVIATRQTTDGTGKTIERLNVDPFGRVTTPYVPAFSMYSSINQNGASVVPFGGTKFNNGSYYDTTNYRFTAPVAGYYMFSTYDNYSGINTGNAMYVYFRKNGSQVGSYMYWASPSGNWTLIGGSELIQLAAGDYVDVYNGIANMHPDLGSNWGSFSGYLVG